MKRTIRKYLIRLAIILGADRRLLSCLGRSTPVKRIEIKSTPVTDERRAAALRSITESGVGYRRALHARGFPQRRDRNTQWLP
ncbi:hypothetical protein [Burkholderia ubonensis]|uniref:hypothetical protein n=1 Tax=Burkholderia ubonensis TaxID=101571 RepID=UPI0012FCD4E8|nr:hypothetical protein [Burkholderia ubonensis]